MEQNIKKYTVNNESVWTGNLFKIKGKIQDTPIHFHIRPLNINDAEQMGELSAEIYKNLRQGEECFIHKHTKEYYYGVFNNPKLHYIGVFVGDKLIGMSYLTICENKAELQEELPNSNYDFFATDSKNTAKIASFGADSVLPDYRGNSLNTIMIQYRLERSQQLGCTDCTSIVDRHNLWNMTPYFTCRFNLFSTAIDPSDGGKISLLHKPIAHKSVLSCFKPRVSLPYTRLEMIDNIINKGFIGVEFNKVTNEIVFAHSDFYVRSTAQSATLPIFLQEKYKKVV